MKNKKRIAKKIRIKRIAGLAFLLAALAIILPLFNISAEISGEPATAYAFSGTEVLVSQVFPFEEEGIAVLYNDGSAELRRRHPETGETLISPVSGLSGAVKLIDGHRALKSDGTVWIWDGALDDSYACNAQPIQGLSNVVDASGDYYLVSAGGNRYNLRELDQKGEAADPVTLFSVEGAKAVVSGGSGSGLILKEDGTVWSFGGNADGQLGIGSACRVKANEHYKSAGCTCSTAPVRVKDEKGSGYLTGIVQIAPGMALRSDGTVYTWGSNVSGKLGNGSLCSLSYERHFSGSDCRCTALPGKVSGLKKTVFIAATGSTCYAISEEGVLYQWGEGNHDNPSAPLKRILTPTAAAGINNVSAAFAGSGVYQTVYLQKKDGSVSVLGYDPLDALKFHTAPSAVSALAPKKAITVLSHDLSKSYTVGLGEALPSLPENVSLTGTAESKTVSLTVKGWECETNFDAQTEGVYRFRPIFAQTPSDCRIVDEVLPRITVTVGSPAREVTGLSLLCAPKKTSYVEGQELDLTGALLGVNYSSGETEKVAVEAAMLSGYSKNKTGSQTVTVTHLGKNVSFKVTVVAREVTAIALSAYPSKLNYSFGEALDVTGGKISLNYNDGSTQTVALTAPMISGYQAEKAGAQTLTVTYSGKKVTFQVTVSPKTIVSTAYSINTKNNQLSKIGPGTTVETLKSKLSASGGTVQIYKGSKQITTGNIGTGMEVKLVYNGQTVQTLTAIVTGDISGDGLSNITDLINVQSVILRKKTLNTEESLAGDINGDGKVNITDLINIQSHILHKKSITPRAV